jgi:hypothetical protein
MAVVVDDPLLADGLYLNARTLRPERPEANGYTAQATGIRQQRRKGRPLEAGPRQRWRRYDARGTSREPGGAQAGENHSAVQDGVQR